MLSNIPRMRAFTDEAKKKGKTIGFVPTMGYLHPGHLSLIRQAKNDCDICVVSIFVNPIQFGPKEDYRGYPRGMEMDRILSRSAGADCVFSPTAGQIYPPDYQTYVNVERISSGLCGRSRPGHFRGVATVVNKLFNIVRPDIAYFGKKDYQQALVIERMCADLNMPLKIKIMPIIREADGLAMSSRNHYLSHRERQEAAVLHQSLSDAKKKIASGESNPRKISAMIETRILKDTAAKIDYVSVADSKTLEAVDTVKGRVLIALAAWFGRTRLIDNIICG
ncbi:MAG TPA: pantoate--beta-alanine ligase [Candidatus Omnitrophota bacterium]|nr:pantoate--beta-alanine ligase [Candidatus Omnitrophota bacterium]